MLSLCYALVTKRILKNHHGDARWNVFNPLHVKLRTKIFDLCEAINLTERAIAERLSCSSKRVEGVNMSSLPISPLVVIILQVILECWLINVLKIIVTVGVG